MISTRPPSPTRPPRPGRRAGYRTLVLHALEDRRTPASFQGLGDLPGGTASSLAFAVSADGSTVVGESRSAAGREAFRWTATGGMVGLGDLPGGFVGSVAYGVSADGSVVVGEGRSTVGGGQPGSEAFRWTPAGGMVGLGDLPGGYSQSDAWDVSDDGMVAVGRSFSEADFQPYRWTPDGGLAGLGNLPGGGTVGAAYAVSGDGQVVVGNSQSGSGFEAFRWTSGGGMVGLGDLAGGPFSSAAYGASADGSTVIGSSNSASGYEAFRWTVGGGMIGLGDLPGGGFSSQAWDVTADGQIIVGFSDSGTANTAFIWDPAHGMRNLADVLTSEYGLDLTGWRLTEARGISADGRTIVGYGQSPAGTQGWIIRLDSPLPDLEAGSLSWNTAQGGVDLGYDITGADLTQPATAGLYWSADDTFDSADTLAHETPAGPAAGSYGPLHVSAADLGPRPAGAAHLLLVLDAAQAVDEGDEANNVLALPVPSLDLTGAAGVDEGAAYALTLGPVTNLSADAVTGYAVHWGDGQTTVVPAADLPADRTVTHTYPDGAAGGTGQSITVDLLIAGGSFGGVATKQVTVANVAPAVDPLAAPTDPVAAGSPAPVTVTGRFADPGIGDGHTVLWSWGDGTTTTQSLLPGDPQTLAASHYYAAAGVYTVSVTVTDDDGGAGSAASGFVVVYDPSAGFVTGGGWIDSPAGAYAPDPTLTGRASFGFVSRYQTGVSVPTGNTQFQFKAAGFDFKSTTYDWLVVAGSKAKYRGTGTVNGVGGYRFLLSATDGQRAGAGEADRFRLKVWDEATGVVVYDNQMGAGEESDAATALGGGSIQIHDGR